MGHPRGFTLLELMAVVAIVAILAAVVIPSWIRDSNKSKSRQEVAAMFAELAQKEEAYHGDFNTYLNASQCPASPSQQPVDFSSCLTGNLATLRVAPPEMKLACTYQIVTGAAGANPNPTLIGSLAVTNPATSWYILYAQCKESAVSSANAQYMMSNLDTTIQSLNEGN